MKPIFLPAFAFALLFASPSAVGQEAERAEVSQTERRLIHPLLVAPLDPEKLLQAVAEHESNDQNNDHLMWLILRAAIEKRQDYRPLLEVKKLRKTQNLRLALAAYRYNLEGREKVLDPILAQLATEEIGADTDSIVILSVLNEWDRSVRAFRKHFIRTDGTGGEAKRTFLATRAFLYPEKYAEMRDALEAPIKWPQPLMPAGKEE
ncbi:hypothetical protein, partial [Roseibacillus ishigakijimensis]